MMFEFCVLLEEQKASHNFFKRWKQEVSLSLWINEFEKMYSLFENQTGIKITN